MAAQYRWTLLFVGVLMAGCSASPPPGGPRVKTYPVTGIVQVDGAPTAKVLVSFHPQSGSKINFQTFATSLDGGKFSATTYKSGDGLPEGTYKLTFVIDESEPTVAGDRIPKDRLSGAYADPIASSHSITVSKDKQNDLGKIDLSTKGVGT